MTARCDVAVIGAGPAGAAAALSAARAGLAVALFEPQKMPADKPCGEGILPAGVAALRALGLQALLARGRALEHIRYVLASGRTLEVSFPVAGCALERPVLQRALEEALASEARITRIARRVTCERREREFQLVSGCELWHARTLIVADGLQGDGAAWLRRPRSPARRHGVRARALQGTELDSVEVHLGRTSEVYLTPLPDRRVNVAALRNGLPASGHSAQALLESALEEHPRAARSLGAWVTPPAARAITVRRPRALARAGAFLAGDAAGGVDPVLGCGVTIALTTGIAAGRAAGLVIARGSGRAERDYARFVRRETRLRDRVAHGLLFLSVHPVLQQGVARLFSVWPALGAGLAARVGGEGTARGSCAARP